ncbi:MAG: hypothetical protein KAG45_00860 [Methyloprofundus sp.]|nr:hypothetical protein [Methyloprofundus sp.]
MIPDTDNFECTHSSLRYLVWAILALFLIVTYWPSLQGPFIFDDIQNIVGNPAVAITDLSFGSLKQALLSNDSGLFKRVLPALSFGINHYMAAGFSTTLPFKLTNLLIHIINSGLLIYLVSLILPLLKFPGALSNKQLIVPIALITFLWALHPLQVSTVIYIVQRMTSMAATFVLLGLCLFVYGRKLLTQRFSRGYIFMLIGVLGGTILGLLCKENAALISCYATVIEFSLFSRKYLVSKKKRLLYAFYIVLVLLPACLVLFYFFIAPGNLSASFAGRPFTLMERVWTEARVLWFYLALLFIPDISNMGLFHDDISVSHDWLQPLSTLVSVLAWALVLILAVCLRRRLPIFTFAVFWYLAGHSMESSILPLELVYEHRNYLPSIGIILGIAYLWLWVFEYLFKQCNNLWLRQYGVIAVSGILIISLACATWLRANYWESESSLFTSIGLNHPESAISQYLYGEILFVKEQKPLQAYPHYFKAAQLNPKEVAFLVMAVLTTPPEIISHISDPKLKRSFSNAHIIDLILHKPLSPWSLTIFDAAAKCILARQQYCLAHIRPLISWLQAVLKSRYVTPESKRQYMQQIYHIQMLNGMYKGALETIRKGIIDHGRALQYYLMQADTLQALGQYQEAQAILKQAELGVRGRRQDLLRKVQQMQSIVTQKYRIQQQRLTDKTLAE